MRERQNVAKIYSKALSFRQRRTNKIKEDTFTERNSKLQITTSGSLNFLYEQRELKLSFLIG